MDQIEIRRDSSGSSDHRTTPPVIDSATTPASYRPSGSRR
jgi:hypothetical protein